MWDNFSLFFDKDGDDDDGTQDPAYSIIHSYKDKDKCFRERFTKKGGKNLTNVSLGR